MRPEVPLLTIGIPTYNFGSTIQATLSSIALALGDDAHVVEVLIVDGGSTDETPDIVAAWTGRLPLRYHRKERRDGIDVDIALTVELSCADYCWLLSADDIIEPESISAVLALVADRPDVVLLSHSNCDAAMRVLRPRHPVLRGPTRRITIDTRAERRRYFQEALTTEALFSFLSGLVVRRDSWDVNRGTSDLCFGSCWSHAVRLLLRMRDFGLTVAYRREPLVQRRGENDSFADRGLVARYALGVDGYRKIVAEVFGSDGVEYRETLRILRAEFTPIMFLYAKRAAQERPRDESLPKLDAMFEALYCQPRFAVVRLLYRMPTSTVISALEAVNTVRHRMLRRVG